MTPSAEVVRLGFVERLGVRTLLGLGTRLCLGGTRYGQLLGLGVLLAPRLVHHLAHQHGAHLL